VNSFQFLVVSLYYSVFRFLAFGSWFLGVWFITLLALVVDCDFSLLVFSLSVVRDWWRVRKPSEGQDEK